MDIDTNRFIQIDPASQEIESHSGCPHHKLESDTFSNEIEICIILKDMIGFCKSSTSASLNKKNGINSDIYIAFQLLNKNTFIII